MVTKKPRLRDKPFEKPEPKRDLLSIYTALIEIIRDIDERKAHADKAVEDAD
ncbi:MAG: hypothetical protein AAFR81_03195 [Chloroflexota bacterium]